MAEDLVSHVGDVLSALTKASVPPDNNLPVIDSLHKGGGWGDLTQQLKTGVVTAETEVPDASSDVVESKSRTAEVLARARLQRHEQFKKVVIPTVFKMIKNSGKNKVICTAFALAGLYLIPNQDFNLSSVIDTVLIGAGTYFGYEVVRDLKSKDPKHASAENIELNALIKDMRKLDNKATIKLTSLIALNFYDSQRYTQATVLFAMGVIAAVLPYGLILGIKYADMKGLDWQNWQGDEGLAKFWQKTGIPKLAGTALIGIENGAQVALPIAGRAAKAVAAGRLIIKGSIMFAPSESMLDKLLEPTGNVLQFFLTGLSWGATGIIVGYGAYSLFTGMTQVSEQLMKLSKGVPGRRHKCESPASKMGPAEHATGADLSAQESDENPSRPAVISKDGLILDHISPASGPGN